MSDWYPRLFHSFRYIYTLYSIVLPTRLNRNLWDIFFLKLQAPFFFLPHSKSRHCAFYVLRMVTKSSFAFQRLTLLSTLLYIQFKNVFFCCCGFFAWSFEWFASHKHTHSSLQCERKLAHIATTAAVTQPYIEIILTVESHKQLP